VQYIIYYLVEFHEVK